MARWIVTLAGLWAAAGVAGAALGAAVEVPLARQAGGLVVEATLNGRFTGRFLLDTGATYCVVSRDVARAARLKGRAGGHRIRLRTASGAVDAVLARARRVEVGRARARDVVVAVTRDAPVPGLDGILGLSFLGRFAYTVDAGAGVLRLEP